MTHSSPIHSWRDVVSILWRHIWTSVAVFLAIVSLAVAFIIFAPREYESTAQYMVRLGHESVSLDPVATVGETMGLHMTSDSIVRSTREIANSDELATKVVERITPEVLLEVAPQKTPSLLARVKQVVQSLDPISLDEKARITFKKNLEIASPAQSNVIAITYFSKSPQLAYEVMQVVSDVFLEEHNRINQTQGSFEFFVEQDSVLRATLKQATEELRNAKQKYRISSIEGRRLNLENRLTETESAISQNARAFVASQSKISKLTEQLAATPESIELGATSGTNQQTEAALRQQLYDLQIRAKELQSNFTAEHPAVQSVQKQLEEVSNIFASLNLNDTATSRGLNPVYQELSLQLLTETANIAGLIASGEVLDTQLTTLNEELSRLNDQEEEIFHLTTQLEVARAKYETHSSKLEQARLEHEVGKERITSVGVIQHPQVNERPAFPNKMLVAAFGLLAAGFGALALPFMIEYLRADAVPTTIVVEADRRGEVANPSSAAASELRAAVRSPVITNLDGATHDSEYASGKT